MTDARNTLTRSLVLASIGLAFPAAANAAVIDWTGTTTGGDGSSWHDPLNWTNTTLDPDVVGTVPTSADFVKLNGATVRITTAASINQWNNPGGNGNVHIDEGGSLTGAHQYTVRYATIHVNDGGIFNANPAWGPSRSTINVNAGGELTGLSGMGSANDSNTLTVKGSFSVGATSSSALVFSLGHQIDSTNNRFGKLILDPTGELNFDLFGNGVNEYVSVGFETGTLLDIDTGTINLKPQAGYTPQVGDTFDLWNKVANSVATVTAGDGSNIVLDGYTLNTSNFATDGTVTVASAVPEPTSLTLLALGGGLLLKRSRNRRRREA